jgi:AmmeMemoRadiSam system protein A
VIGADDRRALLQLARDAIVAHVTRQRAPAPPLEGVLALDAGAFVTVHISGELRGCIGHVEMDEPLGRVITRCAVAACSADPRFPPVTAEEVGRMDIELSILGQLEAIADPADITIGRHGLIVERSGQRGLLLPQVATEWNWDRETFLAHTCRKAGLPSDAWKNGARLWRFEAEVFGESALD